MKAGDLRYWFPHTSFPHDEAIWIVAVRAEEDPASPGELTSAWLTAQERQTPLPWKSEKRRRHWLAGRVAAKRAAQLRARLSEGATGAAASPGCGDDPSLDPRLVEVEADNHGAPRVASKAISITHSGQWALAAAPAPRRIVGLDYETSISSREALIRRVCSQAERAVNKLDELGAADVAERFGEIWTIKEALLKAYGVGLVNDLESLFVRTTAAGGPAVSLQRAVERIPYPLPATLTVATTPFDGHPLSIVTGPQEDSS